jgi:TPR repeat protein
MVSEGERKRSPKSAARWLSAAVLVLGILGASQAHAQAAALLSTPTDAQLANARCVIGLEKFLPADYYYCLAAQTYGEHNDAEAQRFFHTAASWASKPAQYVLGVMALNGDHQPVNRPLALAWLTLAAERHTARFIEAADALRKHLSPSERRESDELLHELAPVYGDATAANRAEARYRDGMHLLRSPAAGSNYCMAGMLDASDLAGGSPSAEQAMHCPPTGVVAEQIDKKAADVFEDWHGHVTVGPLQQVQTQNGQPLPPKSGGR